MNPQVLLDLDGVIVDFVGGALDYYGVSIPLEEIRWDFPVRLGYKSECDPHFWEPLSRSSFWEGLDWTDEGRVLLRGIEDIFHRDQVTLATATVCPEAAAGKVRWIERHLPKYKRKFLIGPPKHVIAAPWRVLVDDHDNNCTAFTAAGGVSGLLPRPWNARRDECARGKPSVQAFLDEVACKAADILYAARHPR